MEENITRLHKKDQKLHRASSVYVVKPEQLLKRYSSVRKPGECGFLKEYSRHQTQQEDQMKKF